MPVYFIFGGIIGFVGAGRALFVFYPRLRKRFGKWKLFWIGVVLWPISLIGLLLTGLSMIGHYYFIGGACFCFTIFVHVFTGNLALKSLFSRNVSI